MVNRPFMVGPQSLLSRANSSRPAIGEMETGRRGEGRGRGIAGRRWVFWEVSLFYFIFYRLSLSLRLVIAMQGRAGWWRYRATQQQYQNIQWNNVQVNC